MPAIDPDDEPRRRFCQRRMNWPRTSIENVNASIIVATALVSGVTPRRICPNTNSGSVDDCGPDVNVVMT